MSKMKSCVCFDDVLLVPRYSAIESRSDVDLSILLNHISERITVPIISSPMDTVTESEMALKMLRLGGLGIIHRYNSVAAQAQMVSTVVESLLQENNSAIAKVSAAVGVSGDYMQRANELYNAGARILCVDIAHGHHILMKRALTQLRDRFGNKVHLMAGNVATLEAFNDLADWGADSIRVGVGGGSICSTRIQTGHGVPTLQTILDCAASDRDALLIADGGIRTSGDIVKALAAGADMVMLGSLLSGTQETPGDVFYHDDGKHTYSVPTSPEVIQWGDASYSINVESPGRKAYKRYRGMASKEAQVEWRGYQSSDEGVAADVPYKGPVGDVIHRLVKGIRSGLSYSGVASISELHARAMFVRQTYSGVSESSTHIFDVS